MIKSIVTPLALIAVTAPCEKAAWSNWHCAPILMLGSTAFIEL